MTCKLVHRRAGNLSHGGRILWGGLGSLIGQGGTPLAVGGRFAGLRGEAAWKQACTMAQDDLQLWASASNGSPTPLPLVSPPDTPPETMKAMTSELSKSSGRTWLRGNRRRFPAKL